jgi:SAM-dependent methyltransferase
MINLRAKPKITNNRYLILSFLSSQVRRFIETFPIESELNLLDIGCGGKPYEELFKKKLRRINHVGIDVNSKSAADVIAIGEYIPFKACCFNNVLSTQTLEHTIDPTKVLSETNRVLVASGSILISTHGIWIEGHELPDMWRWTKSGLIRILQLNGYKIDEINSMSPITSLAQITLLYIPNTATSRYTLIPFFNAIALLLEKKFKNRGPKIHVAHLIKASKN